MPGIGTSAGNPWIKGKPQPQNPTSQFGNPNTFTTAANQQAKDYDKIMGMYGDVYNTMGRDPDSKGMANFESISPSTSRYSRSKEVGDALANLSELSRTGGYSDQGIQDLRERGTAPVRSIYANAQRNVERSKALSGGYSANYGAVTAKMARQMSDEIGQRLTDVNAGIAQNVASNRLSAAPQYASAAERENEARTSSEQRNADIFNDTNKFNSTGKLDASKFNASLLASNRNNQLGAVQGMASLYGTTPALTSLFGNQVVQSRQLGQNQQNIDNDRLGRILGSIRR